MPEERIFYADANGVRIGDRNAVFGKYQCSTRNIQDAVLAKERVTRWPAYMVMLMGAAFIAYGLVTGAGVWFLVGTAGIVSGIFNFKRKNSKRTYGISLLTENGTVIAFASKEKVYAEKVLESLRRAIAAAGRPSETPSEAQ